MKALASEITRKLGKRLAWLRIKVRELTGILFFPFFMGRWDSNKSCR